MTTTVTSNPLPPHVLAALRAGNKPALAIGIFAMSVMEPAFATRQCPPEFGKKSDGFMMVGWSLLLLALVAGIALMYLVVKRTRRWKLRHRFPALLLGGAGMLAVWVGGLGIFFGAFVFAC